MSLHSKKYNAFSTLTSVIIMMIVVSGSAFAISMYNTIVADQVSDSYRSSVAKNHAYTCQQLALNSLKSIGIGYTGNESYTLLDGSCNIETISAPVGSQYLVVTKGASGDFSSSLYTVVDYTPQQLSISQSSELPISL